MGANAFLGNVVGGFEQARQIDAQRQFEDAQARRSQHMQLLGKLVDDPTIHPDLKNWALGELQTGATTPATGKWEPKWKSMPVPSPMPGQTQTAGPPPAPPAIPQTQPPAASAADLQLRPLPPPPGAGVTSFTPDQYSGYIMTPQAQAEQAAQRAGAITGAQAGAQVHQIVMQQAPDGSFQMQPVSGTGQPIGPPVAHAINPQMMMRAMSGMQQVQYKGPNGEPLPGTHDKLGLFGQPGAVYDQEGHLVPNAVLFSPSLVPKSTTSTSTMDTMGNVTTKRTMTPGGAGATGGGAAGTAPAKPSQGAVGGGQAARSATKLPTTAEMYESVNDPVTREALDWATLGKEPKGGPQAVRQVEQRMNQLHLQKALPVPPALQRTIQEQFVARNSAIDLIDDIMANKQAFSGMIGAGKIAIGANPDGSGVLQRLTQLNPQEARVAADFEQLIEHANLLRGPLGATGFRGQQAWNALQAQRGKPLGDPAITAQVLTGMRSRLAGLNSADKLILTGQGMSGAAAAPRALGHQVGETVQIKGKPHVITAVHDDGSFDASPVGAK